MTNEIQNREQAEVIEARPASPFEMTLRKIDERRDQIVAACSGGVTYESLLAALRRSMIAAPKIAECSAMSVYDALCAAAQIGICPDGNHNSAWFIPRWNSRAGSQELGIQIGYNGYIELITRGGDWWKVEAEVVYQGEQFEVTRGTSSGINHVVSESIRNSTDANSESIIAVYAVATHKNGGTQFAVMHQSDIRAARSAAHDNSVPWRTRYAEMCKKSSVRFLAKMLVLDRIGKLAAVVMDEGDGIEYGDRRRVENMAAHEAAKETEAALLGEAEQSDADDFARDIIEHMENEGIES